MEKICDIHTHILPGFDDGADSLEEALEMLKMAAGSGVNAIAATPHSYEMDTFDQSMALDIVRACRYLNREAARQKIPITVLPGMEVMAVEGMPGLLSSGVFLPLNGTRFVLTEFDFYESAGFISDTLFALRKAGFFPVVAHPERYACVQADPGIVYSWAVENNYIQINKGSFLGRFGSQAKQSADYLLRHNLCHIVASDAHSSHFRTTSMTEIDAFLSHGYSRQLADILLKVNPAKILAGQPPFTGKPLH